METKNNLGIWIDHSKAQLININSKNKSRSIVSKFTSETKDEALIRFEILMLIKDNKCMKNFMKKLELKF